MVNYSTDTWYKVEQLKYGHEAEQADKQRKHELILAILAVLTILYVFRRR